MHQTKRIPINELNDYLTCKLCRGYFIDATTIIECLHTFCRSCIVRYLEKNKYCPICDVQVHKTKPLLNVRPDKTLQDIVYKLVPRLFQNEMCRRRDFYASRPEHPKPTSPEQCGEASYEHILTPDETICLSLNYHGSGAQPRYLRCSAAVSVMHLQKLLRSKYDLTDVHRVDILHNQDCLNSRLALMDIAYMYLWKRKAPLELTYRIYENTTRKLKQHQRQQSEVVGDDKNVGDDKSSKSNEWKEVQLRISENGEMCFTGIDDGCEILGGALTEIVDQPQQQQKVKTNLVAKLPDEKASKSIESKLPESEPVKEVAENKVDKMPTEKVVETSSKVENSGEKRPEKVVVKEEEKILHRVVDKTVMPEVQDGAKVDQKSSECTSKSREAQANGKHKLDAETCSLEEPCAKQIKPTVLNSTLGLLSNNHPLKRHSQTRKSLESSEVTSVCTASPSPVSSPAVTSRPVHKWQRTPNLPCYVPKTNYNPVINVPKVQATTSRLGALVHCTAVNTVTTTVVNSVAGITTTNSTTTSVGSQPIILNNRLIKSKSNAPIGYKTLRDPPKTWNPQVSRASMLKNADPGDLKGVKTAKFFKMRNNIPRYLGNPASGVKPMYQLQNQTGAVSTTTANTTTTIITAATTTTTTTTTSEVSVKRNSDCEPKKQTLKQDAKALKISEKNHDTGANTNLKITATSVSIFNPLKLQSSSPKGDHPHHRDHRRSPKSPHSPPKSSPPPPHTKQQQRLTYTPPNPFVPNLASPTLSPSQFLYPPGVPPGFHTYDPRLVAAYHTFLYGQTFNFPPGIGLDLNGPQKRLLQAPQLPPLPPPPPVVAPPKAPVDSKISSKQLPSAKRFKDGSKGGEKSLQNAVEKLTQNRVKELSKLVENRQEGEKKVAGPTLSLPVTKNKTEKPVCKDDSAGVKSSLVETGSVKNSTDASATNNNNNDDRDAVKKSSGNGDEPIENSAAAPAK